MEGDDEMAGAVKDTETEPLSFKFDEGKVQKEMAVVMKEIQKLAETMLFHWKHFPITLPPSITDILEDDGDSRNKKAKYKIFKDLFKAPTFDELEQVAMTPDGGLKKLTEKQLQSVWDNGEFDVDSINFPGQYHRWRLTQLLQKGSKRARDTMLKDISLSLRLLIITARNRFISHFFSLSQSLTGWAKGLWKLLDILIGLPSTSPGDLHSKIQDEHMRYLVAELNTKPHMKKELDTFCRYVKEMCEKLQEETGQTTALKPPPIPYLYQTPKGQEIDLRLFNKDLINNCLPILSSILDRGARGWHVQYRQKLIRELQGKGLSNEEISSRVNVAIMDEYLDRVFGAITSNTELENLQPGIGKLLVDQAKSVIAMKKAVKNVQSKMASHKENLLSHLKTSYPVRSRIDAWTNEQIRAFENEFILRNLWSAHEEAISLCEEQGLMQAVYFLRRDLTFIKERETILIKELSKVRIPNRRYTFSTHIWLPRNYIVTKTTGSKKEVIPTVIRKLPPTQSPHDFPQVDSYTLDRSYVRMTSSRYPFWRWWNYLQRSWKWTWNCMFFFGVVVPWCSPVSLRALLFIRPFFPDLALSKVDGSLYPSEMSKTETFISRLVKLWSHVRKSRQDFEAAPDRGFLGKSLTRHFNRFWNYVIKGSVGSVAICLFFPALCVLSSTASLTLAITAPAWVPVMTLFTQLFFFLVFDFDSPEDSNKISILFEALIWRILIQGCIQPIAAMLTGCIVCPLGALGTSLFGLIRRTGRGLWDTIMFYTVIKSRGRVPINDGFIARRIAGPGLAADYFFQIRPEQAIAALECRLELDELEAWRNQLTKQIELPKEKYKLFVLQCFGPFSAGLTTTGVYNTLATETQSLISDLTFKVRERENRLNTGLMSDVKTKVKLPERDLKVIILQGAKMVEKFYIQRILPKMMITEEEFWERKMLEYRDWRGLASKKFSEIFSKSFLIPLEETDNLFQLKVEHLNLSRYSEMLSSADFRDDLDLVTEVHTSNGEISVKAPSLDISYFDPNKVILYTTRFEAQRSRSKPWKPLKTKMTFDQLQIPLPIPHPSVIALSIYNREHEQSPNNLEDVYCQRIIRAAKEVPYMDLGGSTSEETLDLEVSTPDFTIDNSLSHIAQQERTFSEEDMARLQTPARKEVRVMVHDDSPRHSPDGATTDHQDTTEERIVYAEKEKDTSCVLDMPE